MFHRIHILSIILLCNYNYSQEKFIPNKIDEGQITIDGIISEKEWKNAISVDLDYEVNPGNNITPKEKTKTYILYSDTHLYIGFYAYARPSEIRASVRSRDDLGIISDDI